MSKKEIFEVYMKTSKYSNDNRIHEMRLNYIVRSVIAWE